MSKAQDAIDEIAEMIDRANRLETEAGELRNRAWNLSRDSVCWGDYLTTDKATVVRISKEGKPELLPLNSAEDLDPADAGRET